ncbi:MAG: ABC transporter substrate-binding protein [Clostridiales bacterium]|nr:ABC transporter substrate-binding protein [Clostridiales bacterium]
MINRNKMNKTLLLIIVGCLCVCQTGCRKSPVLVQTVYEQDHDVDEDTETDSIDNDEGNENQDEDLAPKDEIDDSDSKRDQTREDALNGDGNDQADQTYSSTYNDYADDRGTASQATDTSSENASESSGSGDSNSSGSGEGDSSGGEASDQSSSQNGSDSETGSGEDNEENNGGDGSLDDDSQSGTETEPTAEKEKKQIVDARGEYVEVPVDVDTVTAVGEAAVIVEMLGGSGRLLGSSGSFTGSGLVQSVFSSQGVSDVQTWWDDDGSETITSADFEALVAAKPDVCFEISGDSTFSSEQIEALEEAGISYVVIHSFTSISNIEAAVTLIAEVLGDQSSDGGTNAPQIAEQYSSWADRVVNAVSGKGSAKTTLYVSAWDDTAYWEIKNNISGVWGAGYGVAIAWKGAKTAPLNECMGYANLTNRGLDNYYIVPLENNYWLNYVTGGNGTFSYGTILTKTLAGTGLGDASFPAVVVSDSSVKTAIESDFHWDVYGRNVDAAGNTALGFSDGSGQTIGSSIVGDYGIYVNPTGVASWTAGIEAPLEAAWLSYKFQNGEGGISLDELRSMVSEFYSTFYNISVDTSSILGE